MDRFCVDLKAVAAVVSAAKQHLDETGDLPEIEIRLGLKQRFFTPGMPLDLLEKLERSLDTFRDWNTAEDVWKLIHTYYHTSSIPQDRRQLRSDLVFDSEVTTTRATMEKIVLKSATFKTEGSTKEIPVDFRVALSVEKPIPTRDIPVSAVPHRCVIKLRKEYSYSPSDHSEPVLAFHLTKRWSGVAYAEAMARTAGPPECDVEIEILSADYLQQHSADEIAFKMLWKLYSIIVEMRGGDPDVDIVSSVQV